jgi:hypothetical protein
MGSEDAIAAKQLHIEDGRTFAGASGESSSHSKQSQKHQEPSDRLIILVRPENESQVFWSSFWICISSAMAAIQIGLHPSFPVLPLLSSSLTVGFAVVETTIFNAFLRAAETEPKAASKITRLWWNSWLTAGLTTIFSVVPPGVILGIWGAGHSPAESLEWKL